MIFFPCTRFEAKVPLLLRCQSPQHKNYTDKQKLEYTRKIASEQWEMYRLFTEMYEVLLDKGIKAVIENPYTPPHYLTNNFPFKPTIIDKDRTLNGDYYKKPTQYFFLNFKPKENLVFEPLKLVETSTIDRPKKLTDKGRTVNRSLMHPQYASRFIRQYIL